MSLSKEEWFVGTNDTQRRPIWEDLKVPLVRMQIDGDIERIYGISLRFISYIPTVLFTLSVTKQCFYFIYFNDNHLSS